MDLKEFLVRTHKVNVVNGYEYQETRPRIECADGFTMSVQAGLYLYSVPRENGSAFSKVEIGFPSERVEEFMPYCENEKQPTETVYGYVPIGIVQAVIDRHGGIVEPK